MISCLKEYQGFVIILLSIWKFGAKRFAVRMTHQVEDFIPELVAFSVDFFGSLFISVCMSCSSSFYLTALFIGVDLVHLLVKFREISSNEITILRMLQHRQQNGNHSEKLSQSAHSGELVTMIIEVIRNPRAHRLDGIRLGPTLRTAYNSYFTSNTRFWLSTLSASCHSST